MAIHEAIGKSDEWYTPKWVFDALNVEFDEDVASPGALYARDVPATLHRSVNSLNHDWKGFVWMNPPYGGRNGLSPWLAKFIQHGNGVCLVPDRTSAPWWQDAVKLMDAVLFVRGKIKFIRPDGSLGKSPAQGSCLMAIGSKGVKALKNAEKIGWLTAS